MGICFKSFGFKRAMGQKINGISIIFFSTKISGTISIISIAEIRTTVALQCARTQRLKNFGDK